MKINFLEHIKKEYENNFFYREFVKVKEVAQDKCTTYLGSTSTKTLLLKIIH